MVPTPLEENRLPLETSAEVATGVTHDTGRRKPGKRLEGNLLGILHRALGKGDPRTENN
jgi:hypothetical protein